MRKLVVFMHSSLDGFAAGPQGEMDWIHVDDEIFTYVGNRTQETDTALYGRVTFEMMEGYWPTAADQPNATPHDISHAKWYNQVSKIVLSTTLQEGDLKNTMVISDHLRDRILKIKEGSGKDILIFGSPTAVRSLMLEDLIDEYWLFVNPILLGAGIPFFGDIEQKESLHLLGCHPFSSGVVCLDYERKRV